MITSLLNLAAGDVGSPVNPFGGITIGSTPSKSFAGESSKDRRERKKFDRRRRRSGGKTSSQLFAEGLFWKDGKQLREPYATNFEKQYGLRPEQRRRQEKLTQQGKETKVIIEDGKKKIVAASPLDLVKKLPTYVYIAIVGGLYVLYQYMKPKKRGRRR